MKLKNLTPILAVVILATTSCKKEGSSETASTPLTGSWKFISLTGKDSTVHIFRDAGTELKYEIVTDIASSNPKGLYRFSGNSITAEGVGYDYTSTITEREYENNIFQSEQIIPLSGTIATQSGSSKYKLVSADSLYLDQNMLGGTSSAPGGLNYKLEGTKLSLFVKQTHADSVIDNGVKIIEKLNTALTIVLQKQ
ncbi:hypothetical protein [Lacibacter sp.]|uniref:hypothetical protein n=1 Tax=Lacibacter sp. TaxID=1915409 RepID=UPI002B4AD445|nr:hypothetical protein [Lacibacter sp.]HLP36391.1 hypothetical protein [Lacibacter sp.]